MGKMIVLNHRGHEVIEIDLKEKAMELLETGYNFYENVGKGEALELGRRIKANKITDKHSLIAIRQISGG